MDTYLGQIPVPLEDRLQPEQASTGNVHYHQVLYDPARGKGKCVNCLTTTDSM